MSLQQPHRMALAGLLVLAFSASAGAQALPGLNRVGPTIPAFGYPSWYQDKTGVTLEFCSPLNADELAGGWCLLTPDTLPTGLAPETFPANFSDEHFYWAGDASITQGNTRARLVLALEGAFAAGPVIQGDQIVFGRLRIDIQHLPQAGTYVIETPFKTLTFENQVADGRLFYTEDIGLSCPPGQFDCALQSDIGPFLLPSNSAGGAEIAPIAGPVPGRLYLADPARLGPVTGSPINQNWFRVTVNGVQWGYTEDFALAGRLFNGTIPGQVKVDRANYTLPSGSEGKLEVFAHAFSTVQARVPGQPAPPAVTPVLSFYQDLCGIGANGLPTAPADPNALQTAMAGDATVYYGRATVASSFVAPLQVCVADHTARDINGNVVPTFTAARLTDEVTITSATWSSGQLTVEANSSAAGVLMLGATSFSGNSVTVPAIVPPSTVRVDSTLGGSSEANIKTTGGGGGGTPGPVAVNDAVTMSEDSSTNIDVLGNDTFTGTAVVNVTGAPRLGTFSVINNIVTYTPNANANGSDSLTYTVTAGGLTSTPAIVSITVTPVNDVPFAVADTFPGVVGSNVLNVLANDTDVDGQADLAGVELAQLPGAGATVSVVGKTVTFTATATGTFTFTYRALDTAGLRSNEVSVTVTVAPTENLTMTAEFRTQKQRWIISGTSSVRAGQTVTVTYFDGINAGPRIGTAPVTATGAWTIDLVGVTGVLDPRNTTFTRLRATTPLGGSSVVTFTTRR